MSNILEPFISTKQRKSIRSPIEVAGTLPRNAFTSKDFFDLEIKYLFSKQWIALCFNEQVKNKGDLFVTTFSDIPLLVVRGDDNQCRVFHNIVPYDGCLAVIASKQTQTKIHTAYHGWQYDLCGRLIATPHWNGGDKDHLASFPKNIGNLHEISCHTALGILFIHLDDKNKSKNSDFDKKIKPLRKILQDYRIEDLQIGRDEKNTALINKESLATNWKTHYENWALNVLHEAFTHDIYAQSTQIPRVNSKREKTYITHIDQDVMALSYREEDFAETYDLDEEYTQSYTIEEDYPHLGKVPEVSPERAFIGSLFPNVHFAVFAHFIHIIIAIPISAGKTHTLRAQLYAPKFASDPNNLEERLDIMQEFIQAGLEDGRITEAIQKGRRSLVCEQQFYSPFWDTMHYNFSNQVLDTLEKNIKKFNI